MRFVFPALLTLTTALITFWYSEYTKKYQSLFVTSAINLACILILTIAAYFWEGPSSSITKLKSSFSELYFLPYLILNILYVWLWFFLTTKKGAAYTGIYESSYVIVLILLGVIFNQEKFDLKFFIGAVLVCCGIILIEMK